jgi:hypothetical protein
MVTKTKDVVRQARGERTGIVTEDAAQSVLRRGPAPELSAQEEQVMRMRLGASPPRSAPLERAVERMSDLEIEVYAAEIEAYLKWKARGPSFVRESAHSPSPLPSRTKEKIVRALRRKT